MLDLTTRLVLYDYEVRQLLISSGAVYPNKSLAGGDKLSWSRTNPFLSASWPPPLSPANPHAHNDVEVLSPIVNWQEGDKLSQSHAQPF
jgi:hypothetical protein